MADRQMTVPEFSAMKARGQKVTMLTAYDYTTARLVDQAGVEGILVGDSLSMVVQGHPTTLPVTLDEMIYHAEMVGRAVERALVVVDLPFLSYQVGLHKAIENAGRILKETRCHAVKLEGGGDQAETIAALVGAGIPVMAHLGLGPQSVHQLGGFRVQRDAERLLSAAAAAANAGAFAIVLECVPARVAAEITRSVAVPTIGIGAGPDCDGQVLVLHDALGYPSEHSPRFVKQFARVGEEIVRAAGAFREEVRSGRFPADEHTYQ